MKRRAAAWAIAVVLGGAAFVAATDPPAPATAPADPVISMHFDDATLDDAVARIASAVGAEVRGAPVDGARHVTLTLDRVTPEEALRRVLPDQSFSLVYDRTALRTIQLHGEAKAAPGPRGVQPATLPADAARNMLTTIESLPAIRLEGALARATGKDEARIPEVFAFAMQQESPDLRAEASRAFGRALDTNPALRQALTQELPTLSSESTLAAFDAMGGPRVEEFLATLAKSATNPDVRRATNSLLARMRARRQ